MPDNQQFIEATNYLKNEKNIDFSVQAEKIKVKRHRFDSWRSKRVEVPAYILNRLREEFAELSEMSGPIKGDRVEEPSEVYATAGFNVWKEAFLTQKELVEIQKERIRILELENERLKGENEALRKLRVETEK